MAYLNLLNATTNMPKGFWESIIGWFLGFISSYGWAIIVFTIVLKLALLPLDAYQKVVSRKNQLKQAEMAPELEKIQLRYGNNKEMLNQKTMELYKKNKYNVVGSCIGMLVNLVVTFTVFITLFNSMNGISQFKIKEEYQILSQTYDTVYQETNDEKQAQDAVVLKYDEIKESFLWVANVWRPDTNAKVFPNFEEYLSITGTRYKEEQEAEKAEAKAKYELVTKGINEKYDRWNGYYVLIILSALITFASGAMSQLSLYRKKDRKKVKTPMTMSIILSVMMILFTISYSSAFAVYIITNSIMSLVISVIINTIMDAIDSKKEKKQDLTGVRVRTEI